MGVLWSITKLWHFLVCLFSQYGSFVFFLLVSFFYFLILKSLYTVLSLFLFLLIFLGQIMSSQYGCCHLTVPFLFYLYSEQREKRKVNVLITLLHQHVQSSAYGFLQWHLLQSHFTCLCKKGGSLVKGENNWW